MLFSRTALPQRRVWLAVELPLLFGRDCAPQRNAVEGTAESQNGQASERFLIRRQDRVQGLGGSVAILAQAISVQAVQEVLVGTPLPVASLDPEAFLGLA